MRKTGEQSFITENEKLLSVARAGCRWASQRLEPHIYNIMILPAPEISLTGSMTTLLNNSSQS